MTVYRLIPAKWSNNLPILEGKYSDAQLQKYNKQGYNVYFLPNYPSQYESGTIDGTMIDTFQYVFVDCDTKDGVYTKDTFLDKIAQVNIQPTQVVDSGNGVHCYWRIDNLDAMSYLRFQRRLIRLFNTDDSLATLYQLMRQPGTLNQKVKNKPVPCESLFEDNTVVYTPEQFDKLLPSITKEDEAYCIDHYDRTFNINQDQTEIKEELPPKFGKLLRDNAEAAELFANQGDDRSKNDFRLGHLLLANGFNREEALSVLINSAKASQRVPIHRRNYALNIVNKIFTFDEDAVEQLSYTVEEVLDQTVDVGGERFPCYKWIDNTIAGFRLSQVMGLVAGSGVGKTALALNLFLGFVKANPDYDHFFIPLEQPGQEIAARWKKMCGDNKSLYKKVHILSNYDTKGNFRDLSLSEIQDYILKFKKTTGKKVGCVVIDHIGVLKNENKLGIAEGKKHISKAMKSFAVTTNTFLIMQSQTSREKAGIGDLELNKDAAIDTSSFEHFVDFLVTMWQPVKRMYSKGAPTVMAYKFCKIRHKNQVQDGIQEDVPYTLYFDPETELVRQMSQTEETSFNYFLGQATNKRKEDRKTEIVPYISARWDGKEADAAINSNRQPTGN